MKDQRRRATLRDVSEKAGLSLITVSRALRQPETVQEETRKKVHRAIDEIGYVPNLTARSLVSSRSNMIGVVVPILTSSLFADFAQGVAGVLQDHNIQMLLGVSQRSASQEEEAVRTFIAHQADSIIVTGFTHTDACRKMLADFHGPIVETWNLSDKAVDLSVGYNNFAAAADMTRYLLGKGYREIAMVGGAFENNDQATDRRDGFLAAMAEAGRTVQPEFILSVPNPTTIQSGADLMMRLLGGPVRPDAVFFQAELPAQGAMMACLSRGIRIPQDVAIAGFGDLSLSAQMPVPMTTVRIRAHEIGERAATLVLERLENGQRSDARHDIGYDLKIRESA